MLRPWFAWNSTHEVGAGQRRPLWFRVLRGVSVAVLGLWLLYLIGANAFLNFNLLPLAFESTNQVNASIRGGWSVIPGRVHVKGARVTFQDHNVQFSIDMQRGFLVLALRELTQRSFHVLQLRGEGIAFRTRSRIDPWDKNEPWVGALPPIPEFSSPAVVEAYVPEAQIPDAEYNLWKVRFDDVDVGVTELWAQQFRYKGRGRARGKFQLKPARELWVGPATLDLEPGLLSAGTYRVAPGLHGHIDCTVHPFDVRPVHGLEPMKFISARVRLDAPALDPQVYALFGGEPAPRVSSASGSLHVDLETRHGVLTPQSQVDVVQRGFELRVGQGDLDAAQLELHVRVDETAGSRATLLIERATVKEAIAPGHPPHIEHLDVSVLSSNRDTARDFELKEVRLGEARMALGDASWLNRWLKGPKFSLTSGGVSLLARGRYQDSLIDGDAILESNGVAALIADQRVHYAGALTVSVEHADPKRFTGNAVADLSGHAMQAQLGQGDLQVAGLQAHVSVSRDTSGNEMQGRAKLWNLSTTNAGFVVQAPEVTAEARSELGPDGVQLTHFNAQIPALIATGRGARLTTAAQARGTLAKQKNRVEQSLEVWADLLKPRAQVGASPVKTATTQRVALHAALRNDARGALTGKLDLSPAAWTVVAGNLRFSGKSALEAKFAELDLARNSGHVDGRLSSTGVTLGDTTQNADCPWTRVQALTLDGTAHLLERGDAEYALTGDLRQSEVAWGDFLTRGDIAIAARFGQGLFERDGKGTLEVKLHNASLQSGAGGDKGWAANVPALGVQANLVRTSGQLSGAATLSAEQAKGRIGATKISTDLTADFKLDALDVLARTAHASGAVHVRNAALPNVPDPVSKWWADIKLDSLFGRASENLELGGTFRASLRDATPGMAVLASQGSLPKWVASAFPLRDLTVTGSLARRCRLTDIHLVEVSGGPAVARGRLQSLPDGFQGALLVRLAGLQAVSAGLDFDAQHTSFGMFDGDAWLERFERFFDRKSDAATKLVCPPDPGLCTDAPAASVASTSE
ncbi:MAG: hypothetical protein ABUL62_34155 [Myxococcales bacterium]